MFCLNINHPDVEEFLDAKMTVGAISNANISVMIPEDMPTEHFVEMVRNDEEMPLMFNGLPDKLGRSLSARKIWEWLVGNAWDKGEPGLLNWHLVQKMNNIRYARDLTATNPCFAPEARLLTDEGYRTFGELYAEGTPVRVLTDNRVSKRGDGWSIDNRGDWSTSTRRASHVFLTKEKAEVVKVVTDGLPETICTPDHHFATRRGMVKAEDLVMGDKVLVASPDPGESILGGHESFSKDEALAVMAGLLTGDGTYALGKSSECAYLDFWGQDAERMADICEGWIRKFHEEGYEDGASHHTSGAWATRQLTAVGRYTTVSDTGVEKIRLSSTWLANVLRNKYGLTKQTKHVVPSALMVNSREAKCYLAGLFYADGTVNVGHGRKSISVRLGQSNKAMLDDVALVAHANGMRGRVQWRRAEGLTTLPDGKGGSAQYETKENWELILSGNARFVYSTVVGFLGHPEKDNKLREANEQYTTTREHSWVRVRSVEPAGVSDVFCVTEPITNSIIVNGMTTRQCGEQPLSPAANCCLGHLVLPRFVKNGAMDWASLDEGVRLAVRFLDNAIDVAVFPIPENEKVAREERRIGLGVMGLHTMLLDLGMKYDSPEAFKFVDKLMGTIKNTAYDASINLAIEKGPFPLYDPKMLEMGFAKTLKPGIKHKIREHGIRNCCILTVAPTGTTSMVQGVTGGIEPVFSPVYIRRRRVVDSSQRETLVETLVVSEEYLDHPDLVQGAYDIHPRAHMEMQKIVQKHVDSAVSKTINLPRDFPKEELSDLWLEYLPYLKGTTFYREGSREVGDSYEPMKHVPAAEIANTIAEWQASGKEIEYEIGEVADCATGSCDI